MLSFFRALLVSVALVGSVGTGHNEATAGLASIAATRNGIVAGNTVVVAVTCADAQSISNVSDGVNTNSTPDVVFDSTLITQRIALFSFPNCRGGNLTFTANFSAASAFRSIVILELTPSTFDVSSTNQGTSAAPSSGNLTPATNGCLIVGYCGGATALTSSGGFSDYFNDSVDVFDTETLAQSTIATVAAAWTMTSGVWGAIAASYKPLPAGNAPLMSTSHPFHRVMMQKPIIIVSSAVASAFRRTMHPFGAGKGKRTKGR